MYYKKLLNKISNIVKFGYVSRATQDVGDYPVTQASYLGKTAPVEIISPYGICANLPVNTKLIILNISANEENQVAIGFSQQDRFKNLEEGEIVVGSPQIQTFLKFNADGSITIKSNGEVNINTEKINLGIGGAKIARLGDEVTVNGDVGTITSAGNNTSI